MKRPMRYLLSCVICTAFNVLQAQSVELVSKDGFTVSGEFFKTDSAKKNNTWKIIITVTTPAKNSYFVATKTGNMLDDLSLDRYIKVSVVNGSGIFKSRDRYIKAEPANLVTTENSAVYVVKANSYKESFEVDVPTGSLPDLRASLIPVFKELSDMPIVKANDAEFFAGTSPHSRRFLVYERADTLLPPRHDHVLRFVDEKHKLVTTTYSYNKFHVIGNGSLEQDTLTSSITYVDWNGNKMRARISENNFETTLKGDFTDFITVQELHIRNADGNNRLVMLEKMQGQVLALGNTYPADYSCRSFNGRYTLKVRQDGYLVLQATADGHVVWINNMPGRVMFSIILSTENVTVDVGGLSARNSLDGDRPAYLSVTNDGNLIMYRRDGLAMWQSKTAGK